MKAQYNIDSGTVNIRFSDGRAISILCNEVEKSMNLSLRQRSEFDRLVYDHTLEFSELLLSGKLESYFKDYASDYQSQGDNIRQQLLEHGYSPSKADELAREFMRYDS